MLFCSGKIWNYIGNIHFIPKGIICIFFYLLVVVKLVLLLNVFLYIAGCKLFYANDDLMFTIYIYISIYRLMFSSCSYF